MELKQGYKQTELGFIPEDWDHEILGCLTVVTSGGTPDTNISSYWNGSIRWMNSGELNKKFVYDVENRITARGLEESATKLIPKHCVLIGLAGQGKTRGTAALNFIELCTNQSIAAIHPSEKIYYKYLYYNIDRRYSELRGMSTGDGGRGGLNLTIIKNLLIPIPPLIEQTAIANALSDLDALINQTEKLIEKKKAIKQGAMQELLKPKEGWLTKKLGDVILSFQNGNAFSAVGYVKNGTPIVTMAQIGLDGAFNFNESKVNRWVLSDFIFLKSYHLKNGDLIMAMTDVTPEKNLIGRMALVKTKETLLLNQRVGLLRIDSSKTNAYFLKTISNMKEWRSYCIGIASLGVQANIGTKDILNGEILMPDVTLQDEIAEILTTMDNELSQIQHKLTKLKQQKQGMMQALLTGKIRLL